MQSMDHVQLYARKLLDRFDAAYQINAIEPSFTHFLVRADGGAYGEICVKISIKVFEPAPDGGKLVKYPPQEIDVFKLLNNEHAWAPKLLSYAEDNSWHIREWLGDKTINAIDRKDWDADLLRKYWRFLAAVFDFFHGLDEPILIKDVKPQNVSFDGSNFFFFDFNTARPLSVARRASRVDRTGNGSNRHIAPEILQCDLERILPCSEYFSFGSMFYTFATNKLAWTNSVKGLEGSRAQYAKEYEKVVDVLQPRAKKLGLSAREHEQVLACMNPDALLRPQTMPLPD